MQSSGWIEIGKIVGAQGIKGEVRVYPSSDFPERFEQPGQRWLLRPGAMEPEPMELLSGHYLSNKRLYIVRFAGITDRTQAEDLRNGQLLVPASDRPVLEENEYHVLDLIGLNVVDQVTQQLIGTVVDVLSAGNDLLEVQLSQTTEQPPKTVLIPFVEAIVPLVDLSHRRVEITPPPGLIES